jgi:hypothetical protein
VYNPEPWGSLAIGPHHHAMRSRAGRMREGNGPAGLAAKDAAKARLEAKRKQKRNHLEMLTSGAEFLKSAKPFTL